MKKLGKWSRFAILGFIVTAAVRPAVLGFLEPIRKYFSQGSFIRTLEPADNAQIEKIIIQSQESDDSQKTLERKGILVRNPSAKANMVICHGFMCDKYDVGFIRQLFPKGKYNFLTFDFRAHGENPQGQCCTFGRDEAYDVIAAARYFKNHPELGKLPTFVYGFSMGAASSIEAQAKEKDLFKAMILDCPFDSTENIVKRVLSDLKVSFLGYKFNIPGRSYLEKYAFHPYVQAFIKYLLKAVPHLDAQNIQTYMYRFSPAVSAEKISVPCMFIHCKHDHRIGVDAIKDIYKAANGPKRLWITNGRRHYDSMFYDPERYAERITKFFDAVLDGSIEQAPREEIVEDDDDAAIRDILKHNQQEDPK